MSRVGQVSKESCDGDVAVVWSFRAN